MGDGGWSALKLLADAAKFVDKLTRFADGLVCLADFIHCDLQFGRDIGSPVFAEVAVGIGIVFEVGVKFDIFKFHFVFLQ